VPFKNEQHYQDLRAYVREMADRLELRDWTTFLHREVQTTGEYTASMSCTYGRKFVHIYIAESFFEMTLEAQRQTIAHELIHVHFYGWRWAFNNLQKILSGTTFAIVENSIRDQEELAVDAMADAIARYLPLPTKPNRRKRATAMATRDKNDLVKGKDKPPLDAECDRDRTLSEFE